MGILYDNEIIKSLVGIESIGAYGGELVKKVETTEGFESLDFRRIEEIELSEEIHFDFDVDFVDDYGQ